MPNKYVPVLASTCALFTSAIVFGQASFQGLGDLPGGTGCYANAISADGSTATGVCYHDDQSFEAFRWRQDSGLVGLGLADTSFSASSSDGEALAGTTYVNIGGALYGRPCIWTQAQGLITIPNTLATDDWGYGNGVSADGSILVGMARSGVTNEAFRWTQSGGMEGLGFLPWNPREGVPGSSATDISCDGSVIVGYSYGENETRPFRWTSVEGMTELQNGEPIEGYPDTVPSAISCDGTVVVGTRSTLGPFTGTSSGFRWTQETGMLNIGHVGTYDFGPTAVSGDGSIVVGSREMGIGFPPSAAFIWDETSGFCSLQDVLEHHYDLDLTGWSLFAATGISAEGRTIVGSGWNPYGFAKGWIVTLPQGNTNYSALPRKPMADPTGIEKTRFISFIPTQPCGVPTAMKVVMVSLHHVSPPYTGGVSLPFTAFEGQVRWVGPPTTYYSYIEEPSFQAAALQCSPHYQDWSTVGLLHVTGSAIVPSSVYEVQSVAASCMGSEASCTAVSAPLQIATTRWGDVETPYNPPSSTIQPDVGDVGALVNKFRSAIGAPSKSRSLLIGDDEFGNFTPTTLAVDLGFRHIAACVDAFRGLPYPHTIAACP